MWALHVGKKRTSKPIFSATSESFLSAQTKMRRRGCSLHQANAAASCKPSAELSEWHEHFFGEIKNLAGWRNLNPATSQYLKPLVGLIELRLRKVPSRRKRAMVLKLST